MTESDALEVCPDVAHQYVNIGSFVLHFYLRSIEPIMSPAVGVGADSYADAVPPLRQLT